VPDDRPLPDEAIVVRGGASWSVEQILNLVEQASKAEGAPRLSVFAAVRRDGESEDDVVRRLVKEGPVPHRQMRLSTLGQLRHPPEHFEVTQEGEPKSHHEVYFKDPIDKSRAEAFIDAFGPTMRNPEAR
jgi:hypothetical protein